VTVKNDPTFVRRVFEEGINQKKLEIFDELLAPNYVNHSMPTPTPGPEGFKAVVGMFMSAFPDFRVEVEDVITEGDLFSSRGYFTGTQQGDFQGIPPTGRSIKAAYIDIWRIENGKLVENWVNLDMMGMMQQLGVIPT
jgi:predicted ester cyclase